jgi:hypothetical protein
VRLPPRRMPAARSANDNATRDRPVVRTPRGRPDLTYAVAMDIILPLRFAQRMEGWRISN